MTLNYERSYDDSLRKNTVKLGISKYQQETSANCGERLSMSAHTTYMSILFVCFNVGFLFNVFVLRADAKRILFHALCCAGSVVIAGYMPEWMIWASCVTMVVSLIATGVIFYKFDLMSLYRNRPRVTEEEIDIEDCNPEVRALIQEYFKKHHD